MKQRLAVAGQHDSQNNREEGTVNLGGLLFTRDNERKDGGEKGRGGADGLVEGDGEVAEGGVAANDGEAEDGGECEDLEKLAAGEDVLTWHYLEEVDGDVAVGGAGDHVEHCEKDGVAEAVEAEEVLVEEEDADVRQVPGCNNRRRRYCRGEEGSGGGGEPIARPVADVAGGSGRNVDHLIGGRRVLQPRIAHTTRRPCLCLHHRGQNGNKIIRAPQQSEHYLTFSLRSEKLIRAATWISSGTIPGGSRAPLCNLKHRESLIAWKLFARDSVWRRSHIRLPLEESSRRVWILWSMMQSSWKQRMAEWEKTAVELQMMSSKRMEMRVDLCGA
ncbi:hypothetical protein DVH24_007901 [Malus domestica]|uniref:Uncharacterized protein n=1 Tax=Malus domestica TaxID=3750 RepID=A0A498JQ56_MALDO|nr:hypothetical protein DVH24_007901 [Malus domestica]